MERLTERDGKYICIKGCTTHYADVERKGANHANAIVRLAAYEDTGLTPEEITDIIEMFHSYRHICAGLEPQQVEVITQAKKDGRLVVVPCKVGDILWSYALTPLVGIYKTRVTAVSTLNGETVINTNRCGVLSAADVGTTVFLTREEAEAALKRMEEKENETD